MVLGQSARFFLLGDVLHFLGALEVALRPVASRHVTGLALVCTCFEVASISRFRRGLDFSASAWLRSLGLGGRPRLSSPRLHVASIAFVRCLAQKLSLPSNLPSCLPLRAQKKTFCTEESRCRRRGSCVAELGMSRDEAVLGRGSSEKQLFIFFSAEGSRFWFFGIPRPLPSTCPQTTSFDEL